MFAYRAKLKGKAAVFYNLLAEQMAYEAEEKLKRKVSIEEIEKGLKYKYKDPKDKSQITISMGPSQRNKRLLSRYTKVETTIVMTYEFEEEGDYTNVTYRQEDGTAPLKGIQKMLVTRTMKQRFYNLEKRANLKSK